MRILHTADWHIGKTLYRQKRYEEFDAFLSWLAETIHQQEVDVLLVAGDVFDTSAPSNLAQQLYYRFLCKVAASPCRHVIVTAGNHDSPSFLNAPKELLQALNIHVIGSITENHADEVFLLRDEKGAPELIVCAVPYLRDSDIRSSEPGESIEDKERKLVEGIRSHYHSVCTLAEQMRKDLLSEIPIVAMGHLFTAGGQTVDGDGVRDLYVGSLAHVTSVIFPTCIDYLALGHLHVPQRVNGSETMRYCGSPIPMGFGEAKQNKSVCLVDFEQPTPNVSLIKVPLFQALERIQGSWDEIVAAIGELATKGRAWLEIIYEGNALTGDLSEPLKAAIAGTELEVLRVKNLQMMDHALSRIREDETLDDLSVHDVFARCLTLHDVPIEQHPELLQAYQETLLSLDEDDNRAE